MAFNEKARGNLRELYGSKGSRFIETTLIEAIEKGDIKPEEFELKELWEAFTDYAPLGNKPKKVGYIDLGYKYYPEVGLFGRNKREAIGTGSFEKITGALINKKVIDAYDAAETVGQNFVKEVPSKLRKDTFVGMTATVYPDEVPEMQIYPGSGIEEKYVTIGNKKYGRTMEISEEMILFDQTGQVLYRAEQIGEGCAAYKEKLIIEGIQDINTTVWKPNDTAQALYSVSATNHLGINLATSNAFSAAGLEAVQKLAHNMTDDSPETNPMLVNIIGKPALLPTDLMVEAWELSAGPLHPETAENARNFWNGKFVPYTSPWVSTRSTSTWYWGDFKKCMLWCVVWPLQTLDAKAGNYREFEADIKSRHKVRMFGGVGALEWRYIFKSTA